MTENVIVSIDLSSDDEETPAAINLPTPDGNSGNATGIGTSEGSTDQSRNFPAPRENATGIGTSEGSTDQSRNVPAPREKRKPKKSLEKLTKRNDEFMKEMGRFDPENSNRERRKLSKKLNVDASRTGHDEQGLIIETNQDLCDCLNDTCVGCFFPCRACRSCKCGVECRNNRKWTIESVENEADQTVVKNTNTQFLLADRNFTGVRV